MSDIKTKPITEEYAEGFDRTFGARVKARGRFVYDAEQGKLVPYEERDERSKLQIDAGMQYEGLRMTDGTPVNSRRKYREYLRATGTTHASDFTETWAKNEKDRAESRAGGTATERKERREDIGRALYELERKR